MRGRLGFEGSLPADRFFDIALRHLVLFRKRVPQDCDIFPVKKLKNPEIHTALAYPQLVDAVPQDVRKRSAKFMPKLGQPRNRGDAAFICPLVGATKLLEPIKHWNILLVFLVEDDISSRHAAPGSKLSQYCYSC